MSSPKFQRDASPRVYTWTTDDKPCDGLVCGEHSAILVEVRGDLDGSTVQFRGGLAAGAADELALLDEVTVTPCLVKLPPVAFLLPVTDAKGVNIMMKGLP